MISNLRAKKFNIRHNKIAHAHLIKAIPERRKTSLTVVKRRRTASNVVEGHSSVASARQVDIGLKVFCGRR